MRNRSIILAALFVTLMFAGYANGQMPSLASMPAGEKFTSAEHGFTIAMPAKPSETTTKEDALLRGGSVSWVVAEGYVSVEYGEFATGGAKATEYDARMFMQGFKEGFLKELQPVSSFTEAPYKVGDYRGTTYSMLFKGNKVQINFAVFGNKYFAIAAIAQKDVAGSDILLFKAANSFSLTSPVRDKIA